MLKLFIEFLWNIYFMEILNCSLTHRMVLICLCVSVHLKYLSQTNNKWILIPTVTYFTVKINTYVLQQSPSSDVHWELQTEIKSIVSVPLNFSQVNITSYPCMEEWLNEWMNEFDIGLLHIHRYNKWRYSCHSLIYTIVTLWPALAYNTCHIYYQEYQGVASPIFRISEHPWFDPQAPKRSGA